MMAKVPFSGCCWQGCDGSASDATHQGVDTATFKMAMGRLASGVAVVTTGGQGLCNGTTATAICSVSVTPPLVVAILNFASRTNALIRESGAFSINILAENQQDLAVRFSASANKSFDGTVHWMGETGSPILGGCVAVLECILHSAHEVETHTMFVGRVVNVLETATPPLIRNNGAFTILHPAYA